MKYNKGFTLVELLAVIAIIAILAILTLPNIMGLFNNAKKDTFVNEAKIVYQAAQKQLLIDAIKMKQNNYYAYYLNNNTDKLNLDKNDINYCVVYNNNNEIVYFQVSNNEYSIARSNKNGIKVTSLNSVDTIYRKVVKCSNDVTELNGELGFYQIESTTSNYSVDSNKIATGNYIDTKYVPNANTTKIVLTGNVIEGDTALFGYRDQTRNAKYGVAMQYISTNQYRLAYSNKQYLLDKKYTCGENETHTFTIDVKNKKFLVDDKEQDAQSINVNKPFFEKNAASAFNLNASIYLMAINDVSISGPMRPGKVLIKEFRVEENDRNVVDMIAVQKVDDDSVCMYDFVTGEFYCAQTFTEKIS